MIKLIVFDLDGVLVDAKDIHFHALNLALARIDKKYIISQEDHLMTFDGLPTREKLKILTEQRNLDKDLYDRIFNKKQQITKELIIKDIAHDEDLIELLSRLKNENLKLYVASNAIRSTVNLFLSQLGIIHLIDYIYSNEDVFETKPAPEMYLRCMIQARVKPEETIVVEDSPKGLKAAYASGAKVLRVKDSQDLTYDKIQNKVIEANDIKMTKFDYPELNIVIPMAGEGRRFIEAGYTFPKPLIEINEKSMIQTVVDNLNIEANYIFLVRKSHLDEYVGLQQLLKNLAKNVTIVPVDKLTEGAACTVLLAKEYINNDRPLLIANSDQYIEWDSNEFQYMMIESRADGGILTFEATHPKWSYAKTDEHGWVTEVAEKIPISNHATVGIYYWLRGEDYVKYSEQMIKKDIKTNNEFYVCPVYNEAIADGKKVLIFDVDEMHGLGTPEDLTKFKENGPL
jgi:HAD superfamily hydrolase (TIGR01509 family)